MKNLVKFAVVIMMIVIVASCNKKEVEPVKVDDTKVQEKTWAEKKQETFIYITSRLTSSTEDFFEDLFNGKNMSSFVGVNEYYLIKEGNMLDLSTQDMRHKAKLSKDIMAISINGKVWTKGGFVNNLEELNYETLILELHKFPKRLSTESAIKFVNHNEITFYVSDHDGSCGNLEEAHLCSNRLGDYGYRIDIVTIGGKDYGAEFANSNAMVFDEYGKRKPTREEAMKARGEVYNEDVVENFVLLPRDSNQK